MTNEALMDVDFLRALTENRDRTVYAKVVALDINEVPMDEITGRVTQGSITVDGTSSVRRSFSLSLVANEININDYYWGLHSKIQLYIGLENKVDKNYPNVIWFKQGIFIISGFNTAQSVNSYTISMQGKDKMCMLNGELGGVIKSLTADFDYVQAESEDNAGELVTTKEKIPVKDIIRECVHAYGGEPLSNIIINDLDEMGLELLEYRGKDCLYFLIDATTGEFSNMVTDGTKTYFLGGPGGEQVALNDTSKIIYNTCFSTSGVPGDTPTVLYGAKENRSFTAARFEYGEACGYRLTDLVYPGTLTGRVGEPITTAVLDKIKNMLGNFEYFYDVDGHFIFQRKKTYLQKPFSTIENEGRSNVYIPVQLSAASYTPGLFYRKVNGAYVLANGYFNANYEYYEMVDGSYATSAADTSPISYYFGDSNLVTSFNNTPNLSSLKNDFSIWGSRTSPLSGNKVPIHLRYAIDHKPTEYVSYDGLNKYTVMDKEEVIEEITNKYELTKTPNPNGLPETWWNVHEWAEFYRIRAGAYPTGVIGEYTNPVNNFPIWDYFTKSQNTSSYLANQTTINTDDILYLVATGEAYDYHGTYCTHTYTWYMDQIQRGVGAYIHDPHIPDAVIADVGNNSVFDNDMEIHTNLDWREVMYQMAVDYNLHGHKDDFAITIYQHNPELCRPNGTTGYETYYQDLLGFWRTLYNPDTITVSDDTPDYNKKYYKWSDELQDYQEVPLETIAELKPITDAPNILYVNTGNTYSPIYKFRSAYTYYVKEDNINLSHIEPDKQYYREEDGEIVPYVCQNNAYLEGGYIYYEDKGYKRVKILEVGKQYYTRTGSDGDYTYIANPEVNFTDESKIYLTMTSGSLNEESFDFIVAQQFSQGNTYYTIDDEGQFVTAFTYNPDAVYYEKLGFVEIVDLWSGCSEDDLYFYSNPEIKTDTPIPQAFGGLTTGASIIHYSYVPDRYVKNGRYYLYAGMESGEWPYVREVFTSFEFYKDYYQKTGKDTFIPYEVCTFKVDPHTLYTEKNFHPDTGWHTDVTKDPSNLNFWFDFLESSGEISKYAVRTVGDRSKAVNDDNVKSIYYRETPSVIFVDNAQQITDSYKPGYTYIQLTPSMANLFHISAKGKSANDELEEFLYNFTYCTESISMTTIPVYHLQPNTRIVVSDQKSHIEGEYLVTRLTIPLTYNGTMNISATKAVDTIY